jgi:hypothetical protein
MARENQDLQIALIVSVMFTIVLGVLLFLCYRSYTDTAKTLKTTQDDNNKKQAEATTTRDELNKLKRFVGVAESDKIGDIENLFNEDMKKYGGAYPAESQFYRPLVEKMFQNKLDLQKELSVTKDENQQLKDQYVLREAGKDAQLKQFDEKISQVTQDLNSRTESFRKDRDRLTEEANKIKDHLQTVQKETGTVAAKLEAKNQETTSQLKKTIKIAQQLREENAKLVTPTPDKPDGEIRWVNQRNGTVWIDVGKADNLNILTSFSVYPNNNSNLGKESKKASIEVTQVLGDHLAEARILDDKVADPIMPGDIIDTPIWSPGDKRHFALAGFMDVDGDNKNNVQLLKTLIEMNGGIVDSMVDDKGKKIGDITTQTRYLIRGENPVEKKDTAGADGYNKMIDEADKLGIQKISVQELLERMGYKSQTHVVTFGTGADPRDFKAKPEGGINRVSSGNVSEIFKPRQPSRSGSGGAY